ncbi:MAG: glycosyltransferase family 2 protein [Nitrospiraceae bacterium]
MKVSVVVPVRNAERTLPVCMAALAQLNPRPFEILLVENGSTDAGPALMREFCATHPSAGIRMVEEKRRGASAARNAGIRAATGEVVAFTDADCAPAPDWLERLLQPFDASNIGAVAGRVVSGPGSSVKETFSALYTLRLSNEPALHQKWTPWSGGYPTANLAVRRKMLEKLGGFDEQVTIYGEDFDLCARVYLQGASLVYKPEAVVAHHHRTTLRGIVRQAFGFGRSHAYLMRRHGPAGLWVEIPGLSFRWKKAPLHGWVDCAAADKKLMALLVSTMWYGPFGWLLVSYVMWLVWEAAARLKRQGLRSTPLQSSALATLLLLKSSSMTAGRWWGSLKYGALCL